VTPADRVAFLKRVDERISSAAAVESATTVSNWPFGGGAPRLLAVEGRTLPGNRAPSITVVSTGPRYFDTLGVRLIRGRALSDADAVSQQSVVVNRRLADMYFQGDDPIGRRIRLTEEFPTGPQTDWFTIVGISPNIRQGNVQQTDPEPVAYVPHVELPGLGRSVALLVRTRVEPAKATAAMREEVRAVDADMPLFNVRTMDEQLAQLRWPYRVFGAMFTTFALIALILSAVGLYAVTAYSSLNGRRRLACGWHLAPSPARSVG
jgi:hypothetical protein